LCVDKWFATFSSSYAFWWEKRGGVVCAVFSVDKIELVELFRRSAETETKEVGGVPEWLKGTGCKPVGYAYVGSNPTPSTTFDKRDSVRNQYVTID
tara:strand:- start:256 stop:543 length:288 start_codon:yes stop_codon:yes gene_type:complete